jgi:hypothetical protein
MQTSSYLWMVLSVCENPACALDVGKQNKQQQRQTDTKYQARTRADENICAREHVHTYTKASQHANAHKCVYTHAGTHACTQFYARTERHARMCTHALGTCTHMLNANMPTYTSKVQEMRLKSTHYDCNAFVCTRMAIDHPHAHMGASRTSITIDDTQPPHAWAHTYNCTHEENVQKSTPRCLGHMHTGNTRDKTQRYQKCSFTERLISRLLKPNDSQIIQHFQKVHMGASGEQHT